MQHAKPDYPQACRLGALIAVLSILFASLFTTGSGNTTISAQASRNQFAYLPLTVGGTDPVLPPPNNISGALMFGEDSFRSAAIAVDGQGGMHVAFSRVAPFLSGKQHMVFYGTCRPTEQRTCADEAHWQLVPVDDLAEGWPWVQLQLTPEGRPRLMLMRSVGRDGAPFGGLLYRYAECDTNCTAAQSWRSLDITDQGTGGGLYNADYSYRSFALDHLGRPRFVYEDRANSAGDHAGAYYAFCNGGCTQAGNWFEARIDASGDSVYVDEHAVLVFTPDGRPRLFARDGGTFEDPSSKLVYVECNNACDNSASWSLPMRLLSTNSGSGVHTWSAAVTEQGGARLTFYPRGGPFYYLWCNSTCTQPESWNGYSLDLGAGSGDYSALVLDSNARPHIAFRNQSDVSLGYLWCSGNCESPTPQWHVSVVEPSSQIAEEHPVKPLPTCVRGSWLGGFRPMIALDAQDNPRFAYDAEYLMECLRNPDDPNDRTTYTETRWWTSRFVFFLRPQNSVESRPAGPAIVSLD